ncbi:MAG: hypothetical protein A2Z75_03280 [Chloroflexi bacterium RBG_13_50_10]|nr:MAG: hypothetical protein A2Z75_03280 [Chloroflexi bacterium RBG_13_50_10]
MKVYKGSLAIVAVLVMVAVLGGACAPQQAPPAPPPVSKPNQSPVISSITANPPEVFYGDGPTLICVAADPDFDPLTYSWSATEGTISGAGKQVTWMAPKKDGTFTISVTVRDNRGGQTTGSVNVPVSSSTKTVTLNQVAAETGTVYQNNATDYSIVMAGDNAQHMGFSAFWSFDISSVEGKNIQKASLKFATPNIAGDPFSYMPPSGLGGLWLWKANYGNKLPEYSYVGSKMIGVGLMYKSPDVVDVTIPVKQIAAYGVHHFQVEALFTRASNSDSKPDYVEWPSVVLEVTYLAR